MPEADPPEPTFEQALAQIEKIAIGLERGEIELSQAIVRYEQGLGLLAHCRKLIDEADKSVKLLTAVDPKGNPVTAPFENKATFTPPAAAKPPTQSPPQAPTPAPAKKPPPPRKVAPNPADAFDDDYNPPF